jgi:hypothetical protein
MNKYFKATRGWANNTQHVEILKPLTVDDVDITWDEPYWSKHGNSWSRTMILNVAGAANEEISVIWQQELKTRDYLRIEPLKTSHTFSYKVALQGCSGAKRDNKITEGKEQLLTMCLAEQDVMIANCLNILNNATERLAERNNEEYERRHFGPLTSRAEEWVDQDADVADDLKELQELENKAKELRATIKRKRNQTALAGFKKDGWIISTQDQNFDLVGPLVNKLKETYTSNDAFETGVFGRH